MQIEPDTKIVQTYFRRQTSLKTRQVVRTFTCQAKGIQELVVDGFNALPNAGQKAPQRFGPAFPFARLMRWGDDLSLSLLFPAATWSRTREAFICHVVALSGHPSTEQKCSGVLACCKQGCGQRLVVRTGWAKAGNHADRVHAQQQMKALAPSQAIAPANVGLPWLCWLRGISVL